MQPNSFTTLRPQIERAIEERLQLPHAPQDPSGFTVITGFFDLPIQQSLSSEVEPDSPTITVIGIVGNSTGEVHYFPVKALLGREIIGDL